MKAFGHVPVALLALAPFVVVAMGARAVVPRLGDAVARRVARVARVASVASLASLTPRVPAEIALDTERAAAIPPEPVPRARARRSPPRRAPGSAGIVISEARLMRLTARELRGVGWVTADGAQGRPAGVRLSGVGALGLGLADGDVVTSIDGRPTPSFDDATAAGAAAWASGAHAAHATIVRGGETIAVTVEIPANDAPRQGTVASTKEESGVK